MNELSPLLQWVEQGVVPDKIIASRVVNGMTTLTRPVCPYPELPRYSGVGDTTKASSFVCAADSDQDEPTNAAIAGPQKSAVPAGKRHPDLDFDVRVEVGVKVAAIRQNAGRLVKTSPSGAV